MTELVDYVIILYISNNTIKCKRSLFKWKRTTYTDDKVTNEFSVSTLDTNFQIYSTFIPILARKLE